MGELNQLGGRTGRRTDRRCSRPPLVPHDEEAPVQYRRVVALLTPKVTDNWAVVRRLNVLFEQRLAGPGKFEALRKEQHLVETEVIDPGPAATDK